MRLDPKTFWAMTPLELAIASGLHAEAPVGGAPDRNALQALMRSYPDRGRMAGAAGGGAVAAPDR